jgi:signal peptidase I
MEVEKEKQAPHWVQRITIGRNPRVTMVRVIVLVIASVVLFHFVFLPIRVKGESMLPTYREGRINFVNRLAYAFHEPNRGDVVAIRMAGPSIMFMKRIIGKPGETVAYHAGQVWINGQPLEEPYVKTPWNWEQEPRQLGPDEYYFVGDNRSMPQVDHTEGKAPRERIVGKILL